MFRAIIMILILSVASHAVIESQIQQVMEKKVQQVLTILKNSSLSQSQKESQSIKVMDTVFDYETMAKISLGKKWKTLKTSERKQFTKAFEKKIKHSYVDKLRLYDNQKVITKPLKKVKPTRISLESQVLGKTETYEVVYLFYKNKQKNEWYIYDVRLVGVSIVQTYRKQFASFLNTKSFQELLASL